MVNVCGIFIFNCSSFVLNFIFVCDNVVFVERYCVDLLFEIFFKFLVEYVWCCKLSKVFNFGVK